VTDNVYTKLDDFVKPRENETDLATIIWTQ